MNIHVSEEIRSRHPRWEFRGVPWECNGQTWMKAFDKICHFTWYYWFDKDIVIDETWYRLETEYGKRIKTEK